MITGNPHLLPPKPMLEICNSDNMNPIRPNDLQRHRAVSPLKIKIPSKNMHEKPTNATIIHSVY
jgi:hypothetical protein